MRCQRCYDVMINSVTSMGPSIEKMNTREQVEGVGE